MQLLRRVRSTMRVGHLVDALDNLTDNQIMMGVAAVRKLLVMRVGGKEQHAQAFREAARAFARPTLKLARIEQTCHACPSQWDAWTEDGTYIYIRYRYGYLTVTRYDDPEADRGDVLFAMQYGDDLDGTMNEDEMLLLTGLEVI